MPAVFFIDHLPVDHFAELDPAVILFQVTTEGKDKIVNTELSIVDISVHFWLLDAKKIEALTHKPLHLLYQIHEEDFEFSLYLRDFLRTVSTVQQTLNKAVTIPSLTKSDLLKIELSPPDIFEQQCIVDKLLRIEVIISLRKKELSILDEFIKARFVELFGDPVSNPKRWEKKALSDEADIKIGPFGSLLHKEDYIAGGHALVNPSHIVDGKIAPDDKLTVSDEKYADLSAYHLQVGDVVMGRRGEMGRCAVVEQDGLLCGTGSLLIRTNGDLSADYIQKIISFPSFKRTIEDMAVGQTMPNLNVPIVSAFQIIKPPKSVQEQYYAFVAQIDKSKLLYSTI